MGGFDELNRTRNYLYPLFFLFVEPRLFIQNHRSLMVSQFVSSSDLVDHDGIASAYIGAQISMRQGDSRARKGYPASTTVD
jgi:hypothetical protein